MRILLRIFLFLVGLVASLDTAAARAGGLVEFSNLADHAPYKLPGYLARPDAGLSERVGALGPCHAYRTLSHSFDRVLAINSMQVWLDAIAGLREIRRVVKPGGGVALGFTPYSWQPNKGLTEMLLAAGFTKPRVMESAKEFCALATKDRELDDSMM